MNEELKKIINYVIDHGKKSIDWDENGMTVFHWVIKNWNHDLHFDVDYISPDNISYSLTLFFKNKLLKQLYFGDYLEFDYKDRDDLLKLIRELGVL